LSTLREGTDKTDRMPANGYREPDLVSNRASVLLFGGSEADRRAWADEAMANFFDEGPLVVVEQPEQLSAALARPRGVVFVRDAAALGWPAQGALVRCLTTQEERPKLVVALAAPAQAALEQGLLRDDLHFRLRQAQVNLSAPEVKEAIRARRAKAQAKAGSRSSAKTASKSASPKVSRSRR
jgi:hypothetical protein